MYSAAVNTRPKRIDIQVDGGSYGGDKSNHKERKRAYSRGMS